MTSKVDIKEYNNNRVGSTPTCDCVKVVYKKHQYKYIIIKM